MSDTMPAAAQIIATENSTQGETTTQGEVMTAKTKIELRRMADFYLQLVIASLKSCDPAACMRAAEYFRFVVWPAIREWVPVDEKYYQKLHKKMKGFLWVAAQVKMNRGADLFLVDDFVGDLGRCTVTLLVLNNFIWGYIHNGGVGSEIKTQCLPSLIGDAAARFVPQIHWRFASAANFTRATSPAIAADANNAAIHQQRISILNNRDYTPARVPEEE